MISRNNLSQSRLNYTLKKDKSYYNPHKSNSLIPTSQQLLLFVELPTEEVDQPPYPLQIKAIFYENRINPNNYCKLVHYESGLNIPGQFTYGEAKEILETTRYWDFSLDKDSIPKCAARLRSLLENICLRSDIEGEANA